MKTQALYTGSFDPLTEGHMDIIRRGPGERRHFLDMDISRINTLYLNQILGYNRVLESRNRLLKKPG